MRFTVVGETGMHVQHVCKGPLAVGAIHLH